MKYISKLYFKSHSLKQTPFFKAKFLEYCNIYNNFLIKALFLFQHSKLFVRIVFYKSAFSNIAIYHLILTQVFSCEFCEISKNTFFLRTPLVAASEKCIIKTQSFMTLITSCENFAPNEVLSLSKKSFSYKEKCRMVTT